MPIKPNQISAPAVPPADGQRTSQPAKGLKQAVARLAKPFKSFGARNEKAPVVQPPDLQNKTPTPQMLAKAREQAESFVARNAPRQSSDAVFASTELDACSLKLVNVKLLLMDIEDQRAKLVATLADSSASSQENQLQIRYEILKIDHILSETKKMKTECEAQVSVLFGAQVQKIKNHIDGLQSKLASSSGSKQLDLRSQITQAEFELFKLNVARDEGKR